MRSHMHSQRGTLCSLMANFPSISALSRASVSAGVGCGGGGGGRTDTKRGLCFVPVSCSETYSRYKKA